MAAKTGVSLFDYGFGKKPVPKPPPIPAQPKATIRKRQSILREDTVVLDQDEYYSEEEFSQVASKKQKTISAVEKKKMKAKRASDLKKQLAEKNMRESFSQHLTQKEYDRRERKMAQVTEDFLGNDELLMQELVTQRNRPVFGGGTLAAHVLVIGEYPMADETKYDDEDEDEKTCTAFRGKLNSIFLKKLQETGIDAVSTGDHCWYTYLGKIKPERGRRKMTYEEIKSHLPYLLREIAIIRPKMIVCLGDVVGTLASHSFQLDPTMKGYLVNVDYDSSLHHSFRTHSLYRLQKYDMHVSSVHFPKYELVSRIHLLHDVQHFLEAKSPHAKTKWLKELQILKEKLFFPPIPYIRGERILEENFQKKGINGFDEAAERCGVTYTSAKEMLFDRSTLLSIPVSPTYVQDKIDAQKDLRLVTLNTKFVDNLNEYRMICRTEEGFSAVVHIQDPEFRFFVKHESFDHHVDENGKINYKHYDAKQYEDEIFSLIYDSLSTHWRYESLSREELRTSIGIRVRYVWKRSAFFYQPTRTRYLEISYNKYDCLHNLKAAIEWILPKCEFFETKFTPIQQLYYSKNIYSYGWVKLDPKKAIPCENGTNCENETTCDLEFGMKFSDMVGTNPNDRSDPRNEELFLFRTSYVDMEMPNQGNGTMPNPESDPVCTICVYTTDANSPKKEQLYEVLRKTDSPEDVIPSGRTEYVDAVSFSFGPHEKLQQDRWHPKYLPFAPKIPEHIPKKIALFENPDKDIQCLRDIYTWNNFFKKCKEWVGYVGTYRAELILKNRALKDVIMNFDVNDKTRSYIELRKLAKRVFLNWKFKEADEKIELPEFQPPSDATYEQKGSIHGRWDVFHPKKRCFYFKKEEDLITAFCEYIRQLDPDMLSGHNAKAFDFAFLIKRIRVLNLRWNHYWKSAGNHFLSCGRGLFDKRNKVTSFTTDTILSKKLETRASGTRIFSEINVTGRDTFDTMTFAQGGIRDLGGFTLSEVAQFTVGDTKHDVPWSAIRSLWLNRPKKLTDYCMQDTELCPRIISFCDNMSYLFSTCRRIGNILMGDFYSSGVTIKVMELLIRRFISSGLDKIMPDKNYFSEGNQNVDFVEEADDEDEEDLDEEQKAEKREKVVQNIYKIFGEKYEASTNARKATYVGATVIDPIKMFSYIVAIILDFASLYPSIMDEKNIGITTLLTGEMVKQLKLPPERVWTTGEKFLNPHTQKMEEFYFLQVQYLTKEQAEALPARDGQPAGLAQCTYNAHNKTYTPNLEISDIVAVNRELGADRASYKYIMTLYPTSDPRYKNANQCQMSRKDLMNSSYGATGVSRGPLACKACGASVTWEGRNKLQWVQSQIPRFGKVEGDENSGGVVVGGDTDSVFTIFPGFVIELNDTFKKIKLHENIDDPNSPIVEKPFIDHVTTHINRHFRYPVKMLHEKNWRSWALYEKKKGDMTESMPLRDPITKEMYFDEPKKYKVVCKGTEGKRRSTAPYAKIILKKFVEILWAQPSRPLEESKKMAEEFIRDEIAKIRSGNFDYSQFVLSRYYAKTDFASEDVPVLQINKKRRARGIEQHPLGSRVPMVVVETSNKKAKFFEKVEDPDYAMEHQIPLDIEYYIEKHLKNPILRKIAVIDPSMAERMFLPAPQKPDRLIANDPLANYLIKGNTCVICRSRQSGFEHVCVPCSAEFSNNEITHKILKQKKEALEKFETEKQVCYTCLGLDEPGDITCNNVRCPQYPKRKNAEFDYKSKAKIEVEWMSKPNI